MTWISVLDQLPTAADREGWLIVAIDVGGLEVEVASVWGQDLYREHEGDGQEPGRLRVKRGFVTHWMPPPPPPN
jgi:hypothetical protein